MAWLSRSARAELRRIYGMLKTIADLAEHSELTAVEGGGEAHAARQYNAACGRLVELEVVGDGFFIPLEGDASWADLRSACAQVAGYIEPDVEEARPDRPIINFQPNFTGEVTTESIGALLREIAPDGMGQASAEENGEPASRLDDVESKIAELGGQMQVLAERLHRNDLSADEVKGLADQLRDLGKDQTQLAEEHARARASEA